MKFEQFYVSVIIPVYNGESFLADAVESIQKQKHHPLEIIIVDDGSTDGSAKIAAMFKGNVSYIYQPNSGPAAARNKGLRIAKGNVIGFLDSDDLWPENKLEIQLACLSNNPLLEIVQGFVQYMRPSNKKENKFENFSEPCVSFNLGSGLYKKSVFDKVGFLDETMRFSEDVDWLTRAREKDISTLILKETTLLYRRHQENMTWGKDARDLDFIKALKKSLDRRREQKNELVKTLSMIPKKGD